MFLRYILCAAAAYLLGSISTGVLLSRRLFHDDVRKHGSGGTGATNMLRTYRLKAALLTFAGDAAKAALAVLLGRYLAGFEGGCVAAVFAIVGHMWPLYFGFRGGKGIACTVGAIAVLYPILLVPLVILWGVPVLCSRCISLGSIIAALGLTPAVALWCHGQAVEPVFPVGGAAVMTLLILWVSPSRRLGRAAPCPLHRHKTANRPAGEPARRQNEDCCTGQWRVGHRAGHAAAKEWARGKPVVLLRGGKQHPAGAG